jgi:hypothetical protein
MVGTPSLAKLAVAVPALSLGTPAQAEGQPGFPQAESGYRETGKCEVWDANKGRWVSRTDSRASYSDQQSLNCCPLN